jgi:tetratricopeptide (TPR) repeat protein
VFFPKSGKKNFSKKNNILVFGKRYFFFDIVNVRKYMDPNISDMSIDDEGLLGVVNPRQSSSRRFVKGKRGERPTTAHKVEVDAEKLMDQGLQTPASPDHFSTGKVVEIKKDDEQEVFIHDIGKLVLSEESVLKGQRKEEVLPLEPPLPDSEASFMDMEIESFLDMVVPDIDIVPMEADASIPSSSRESFLDSSCFDVEMTMTDEEVAAGMTETSTGTEDTEMESVPPGTEDIEMESAPLGTEDIEMESAPPEWETAGTFGGPVGPEILEEPPSGETSGAGSSETTTAMTGEAPPSWVAPEAVDSEITTVALTGQPAVVARVASGITVANESGVYEPVQRLIDGHKYVMAYRAILPLARQAPQDQRLLFQMALCLEKMNRHNESLLIYRKLIKKTPNDLFFLEKIADRLFSIGDYVRAQIIYKKLLNEVTSSGSQLLRKIQQCKEGLMIPSEWDSLETVFMEIGARDGGPLTQHQLDAIDRVNRQLIDKNKLMWELFFLQTKKLSPEYLKNHFTLKTLKSSDGRSFRAFFNKDYRFLAHFSPLSSGNPKKILDKEYAAKQDLSIKESDEYFWRSMYKVCTSLLQYGKKTFFSGRGADGLGFILDVPDPDRNVLHAFGRDTWTPSFSKSSVAKTVTGQSSEEQAIGYNDFMQRYQVVSQFVYGVYQNADRECRYQELLEQIENLGRVLTSNPISRLIASTLGYLKSLVGFPDANREAIQKFLSSLSSLCQEAGANRGQQKHIMELMKGLERYVHQSGDTGARERIGKKIETTEAAFATSLQPLPEIITSPDRFAKNTPLILDYLDTTIAMVSTVLARKPSLEASFFEMILRRKPKPGERLIDELTNMRRTLDAYVHQWIGKISKRASAADYAIFCRTLSPKEVMSGTLQGSYSEVGVRTNISSDAVGAKRVSFKAVVVERASVKGGVISSELADHLEMAKKVGLPIILI